MALRSCGSASCQNSEKGKERKSPMRERRSWSRETAGEREAAICCSRVHISVSSCEMVDSHAGREPVRSKRARVFRASSRSLRRRRSSAVVSAAAGDWGLCRRVKFSGRDVMTVSMIFAAADSAPQPCAEGAARGMRSSSACPRSDGGR